MPLGFEHGTVVPSPSGLDSQLTEDESQLTLYPSLVEPETVRAPSWSPLKVENMAPSSSPLSSPPESQSQRKSISNPNPKVPRYRPAAPLPFELAQHVLIYFEESLHLQAFSLLTSLLSSGASLFNPKAPVDVPSPPYLALAATLSVHPRMTTKTLSREHHEQVNAALRLLRLTNKVVGPINAKFASAFEFRHYEHRSRQLQVPPESSQSEAQPEPPIDSIYSGAKSLFSLAEDFWHVVGWAFNCSCLDSMYAARWSQWSLWLDFMIQALESDWELRFQNNTAEESLILQFIESATSGYGRDRRIMRAIFADGSPKSLNEFKEVFKHELSPPKTDGDKPKKREVDKLDIEAEIYGDYLPGNDDDDTEEENKYTATKSKHTKSARTRTPSTRRITPRTSNQSLQSTDLPSAPLTLGPPTSLTLRHRLLHLLSHISGCATTIPSFIEIPELYTLIAEFVRPLPISIFSQFIVSLRRTFSPDAHATLLEILLQGMLENVVDEERYLTRAKMINCYLPFESAKGDVGANCRVSVLLEELVRGMRREDLLDGGVDVQEAVRRGVRRRGEVLNRERRVVRGTEEEEELAAVMLRESGWGLLMAVGAKETDDDDDDDNDNHEHKDDVQDGRLEDGAGDQAAIVVL